MMKTNWDKQATQFLKLHGWKFKDGYGSHVCFPLSEDFTALGSIEEFCETFYGDSWRTYKSVVEGRTNWQLIKRKA